MTPIRLNMRILLGQLGVSLGETVFR